MTDHSAAQTDRIIGSIDGVRLEVVGVRQELAEVKADVAVLISRDAARDRRCDSHSRSIEDIEDRALSVELWQAGRDGSQKAGINWINVLVGVAAIAAAAAAWVK